MIDVRISGAFTYKVNHCTKSDQVYIYNWNSVSGEWDMQAGIKGECTIILEAEIKEDKQPCQD